MKMKHGSAAAGLGGLILLGAVGMGFAPGAPAGAVAAAEVAAADSYTVDSVHSTVLFRIQHAGVGVFWGRFNEVSGSFLINTESPSESFFKATVPVGSVDTANEKRDQHLESGDFFNARQYPEATFESTSFAETGEEGVYDVKGDLTLFGQTKPITAKVTLTGEGSVQGKEAQGFEVDFTIKRADFGNSTYVAPDGSDSGGLGNEVRIIFAGEGTAG